MKRFILLGLMGLMGLMGLRAQTIGCNDTVRWGTTLSFESNKCCWTVLEGPTDCFYSNYNQIDCHYDTLADHRFLSPWVEIPSFAATDSLALIYATQTSCTADYSVAITTDGVTFDTLRRQLVSDYQHDTLLLGPYAGQVVRFEFCHYGLNSTFDPYAAGCSYAADYHWQLLFSALQWRSLVYPVATCNVGAKAYVGETTTYGAGLAEGSNTGLTYTWHSTLTGLTLTGDTVTLTYSAAGSDTLTVVIANAFGSDTLMRTVKVVECGTVTANPWIVDFSTDYDCWRNIGQTDWGYSTENGTRPIIYATAYNKHHTIVSPAVQLPADSTGLRLYWQDKRYSAGNQSYRVLVTTGAYDSLAAYDTIYSSTLGTGWTPRSASLAAYAGQTVHIAFDIQRNNSSGSVYISDVQVYNALAPLATLFDTPDAIRVGDTVNFNAHLTQGDTTGLSVTLHSALKDSAWAMNEDEWGNEGYYWLDLAYNMPGIETVTVTISNAYGSLTLSKSLSVNACDTIRTFPWEEDFVATGSDASYAACWQISGWARLAANRHVGGNTDEGGFISKNDLMQSSAAGDYMITPPISVPATGVEHLALWLQYRGVMTVVLSTQGDSALSLFTDTLFVSTNNNLFSTKTIPLAPYAGQTVHVGIIASGSSKYIDRVAVADDILPVLYTITAPAKTRTDSTIVCSTSLRRGDTTGVTYTWHSSLMDTSLTPSPSPTGEGSEMQLTYTVGGMDTITVVATNVYGSDTATTTVKVVDCTPATELPWTETFAEGILCWYKPAGSNWQDATPYSGWYEERRALKGVTDTVDHWIVSKAITLPADTNLTPMLFWGALPTNNNIHPHYSVLVSTSTDPTDLTAFTALYEDTTGLQAGNWYWSTYTQRSVSLAAYAGQTIHIAFCNHPVSSGSTGVVIDNVTVRSTAVPVVRLTAPTVVESHEPVTYTATLSEGNLGGLTYSWHSTLLDTVWVDNGANGQSGFNGMYEVGGTDTLTVIATNAYGSDTATAVVTVTACAPIATLPWTEDFTSTTAVAYNAANGKVPNCWRRYWTGSNANYAPHVIGAYLNQNAIHTYTYTNNNHALLLLAGTDSGYDSAAVVESPTFDVPLGDKLLSFYYQHETAERGTLRVGYMQDGNFVALASMESQSAGRTDTVSLIGIPADVRRFALQFEKTGTWYGVIVDNITVTESDTMPSVRIAASSTAFVGDTATYHAVMTNGLNDNLSFVWHSSLLDSTIATTGNMATVFYTAEGTDTVSVVATNAYGSDTAWTVVSVGSHPLPQITLTAPAEVYSFEDCSYSATLNDCSRNGLTIAWHSTLLDSTATLNSTLLTLNYPVGGVDTVSVIATNAYGADTASAIVRVYNCQGYGIPYHEDFSTISANFPFCWSYTWDGAAANAPQLTGTSGRHLQMKAGGYDYNYSGYYTNESTVTLPRINDTLNRCSIAVRYNNSNNYYGVFSIGYMDSGTFVSYATIANSTSIEVDTVSLNGLPDTVNQLTFRWRQANTYSSYTLNIYEIDIFGDTYVYGPNNLHVDSLGAECVRLTWTPKTDATAYHVVIDGEADTVVATPVATLCGLASNTQYTVQVACISGIDTGNYVAMQFTTMCHILSLPWFEDFDGSNPLQCWSHLGSGNIGLPSSDNSDYYARFCHSGSKGLRITSYYANQSSYAVTPLVEAPGNELLVSFWANHFESWAGAADSLEAGVLTVPGDTLSFVPLITCSLTSSPTRFEFDTRSVSADYVSVAFRLYGNTNGFIVDDITVEQLGACARLRGVSSYPVDARTAVVEWQYDTASAIPNTGALITLSDIDDSTAAPITVSATGSSYAFTGLSLSHRYEAAVQALCTDDTTAVLTTAVVPSGSVCAERSATGSSSFSNGWSVINCDRPYSYSQTLYPAVIAATVDTLFGIAYRITSTGVEQYQSSYDTYSIGPRLVDVYIGQTTADTLTAPVSASNLTLAVQNYELPVDKTGWVRINFTNPVPLDGVSNLIVTVDDNTGAIYGDVNFAHHTDSPGVRFQTSSASYSYTQTYDPYNPTAFSPNSTFQIPDIQLLGGCSDDRCLQPLVTVAAEDTHSISLAWGQRGSESLWRVEYHVDGDSLWTVAGNTTDTAYTIGGLNSSTGYQMRVSSLCSGQAVTSDMIFAHTLCGTVGLPYHQTFRNYSMPVTVSSLTDAIACWDTRGNGLLSQGRGLWNTHQNGDYIISPEIGAALSGVSVRLTASGSTFFLAGLKVGACDADGANLEWIDTITLDNNAQEYTVYLTNYMGNERHIAIGGSWESWTLYDVAVKAITNCQPVHHVSLGQIDDTSATIHWPAVDTASTWAVYLDDSLVGVTHDTLFAFGNLVSGTTYTLGVREICWPGDTAVSTTLHVTTLCTASLPWSENFDGGVYQELPSCWYPIFRPHTGSYYNANILESGSNPYLYFYDHYSPYDDHDRDTIANFLCSPVINAPGRAVAISFSGRRGSYAGVFQAGVMTNPADTSSFIPMITLTSYSSTMTTYQFTTAGLGLPDKFCLAFRQWGEATCAVDDINATLVPLPVYSMTLSVNDTTMGTVSGAGTYDEGTNVTITATPNDGYRFVMWNDSVTVETRTVKMDYDTAFTAFFEPDTIWHTVTISPVMFDGSYEPQIADMVSGAGTYAHGDLVTLEGEENGCSLSFAFWITAEGDTLYDNPYTFAITSDVTVTAVFAWFGGIEDQDAGNGAWKVYPNPAHGDVTVSVSEPSTLKVVDLNGREVVSSTIISSDFLLPTSDLPAGTYFIQVTTARGTSVKKLILR